MSDTNIAPAPAHYACLDVGTNSIKITVADLSGGRADLVFDQTIVTRLGEGMHPQALRIREAAMRRSLDALAELVDAIKPYQVLGLAAVGTAALRDAENRDDFLRRAEARCGVRIEVIPGEEEARLSYLAVRRDPHWREQARLLVIDIGGGSTELIQGATTGDGIAGRVSVNLGAVKMTEQFLRSDPPSVTQLAAANQAAREQITRVELAPDVAASTVVGVGGTHTNLAAMALGGFQAAETIHGYLLSLDALEDQIARLSAATVAQRKQIPGLDPRRADIILGGAILLSQALARIGAAGVTISTRGLRWGVLYDRFLSKEQGTGNR